MAQDKKPFIDKGHYTREVRPSGDGVVSVPSGESFSKVFILDTPETASLPIRSIEAGEGSKVDICIIVLPGVDADIPLDVFLDGEWAQISLSGIYLCDKKENVSFRTQVHHVKGNCISDQKFNGIASGKASASFFGRIVVAPDAQKTEAYQSNRNILLSYDAKVNTKPQLEIYADDVKCSHGATTGRLDENEQFYMRSRGIPEKEAMVLQMISFISPVIDHISDPVLKEDVSERIEKAIRGMVKYHCPR